MLTVRDWLKELCARRPRHFVERYLEGEVPEGWRELLSGLTDDLVEILGDAPDHKICFTQARVWMGGLQVRHLLLPSATRDHPTSIVVAALIDAAKRRSFNVCDACGAHAVLRRSVEDRYMVRCSHHAEGAPPIPDVRDAMFPLPPPSRLAKVAPTHGGVVHQACGAFPSRLVDLTDKDEVPHGWERICRDLLTEVADLMRAASGAGFELKRLYAVERHLRWRISFAGQVPRIVAMAIRRAFLRAADEARWICLSCGAVCDKSVDDGCGCASQGPAPTSEQQVRRSRMTRWSSSAGVEQQPESPSDGLGPGTGMLSEVPQTFRIALYKRSDIAAALGRATCDPEEFDPQPDAENEQTEHQARIRRIMDRGEDGRWRTLVAPTPASIAAVSGLARSAPHLAEVTAHVVRHMRAARAIGMPLALPPMLILGPPGVGKTWLLSRIAEVVGVPHRIHPMNLASLNDGIGGSHPVWRNSAPGLLAKTLLGEESANPIIVVDEFDKGNFHGGLDPYRPFYTLFEPLSAKSFVDEYLGFPMDASNVMWVASANEIGPIPLPIRSRLTTFEVEEPEPGYLEAVVDSIYAEANAARRSFFRRRLDPVVRAALCEHPPRTIRLIVEDAMVRAAAVGRRSLSMRDLVFRVTRDRLPFGFFRS